MPNTSGETNVPIGDWTTGTLKVYHDDKIEALKELFYRLRADDKEALLIALNAADKANDKSEAAQQRVNTTQNEFRGALKDQAATLMPRAESEQKYDSMQKQLDDVKRLVYVGLGIVIAVQFAIGLAFGAIFAFKN